TLIQELIAKIYTPLVVGQAWEMLDPASTKEIEEEEEEEKKREEKKEEEEKK
ncbi:unnamed protein product, partial [marine sediment metagenome]